jgi:branched-chain amino acid aminotransferase
MAAIWLNGEIVDDSDARLSVHDRGFTLADGVFETMRARGGRVLWLADHLARLRAGAALLRIPCPLADAAIADGAARLAAGAGREAAVRLTLTRGPAARRGLWPPGEPVRPTMMATAAALPERHAVRVVVARSTRRNEHSPLSRIKSLNYGDNLLARQEASGRDADDALMLNAAGHVACATVGNVFLRLDGGWITPPIADGVLGGLARARLIRRLAAREASIAEREVASAQCAVISNSLGCTSVRAIDGRPLEDAPEAREIDDIYEIYD